jgi:hypothetical protein
LLSVEALHSGFAEISRFNEVWRFSFGVRRHGFLGSGISSLDYLEIVLNKGTSTANACLRFPSLRRNVKELPKIDEMIEKDKEEQEFGGRGGIHNTLIAFYHQSPLF